MNLMEELRTLDPRDPGRWPLPIRIGAVAIWFVVLTFVLSYLFVWQQTSARARAARGRRAAAAQRVPRQARQGREPRGLQAAAEGHRALLRRAAAPAARQDRSAEPAGRHLADRPRRRASKRSCSSRRPSRRRDFYAELPIKIRLSGSYHEFGEFVSGIAALPRIVTLHDIEIKPRLQGRLRPAARSTSRPRPTATSTKKSSPRPRRSARSARRQRGSSARSATGWSNMQANRIGLTSRAALGCALLARPRRLLERRRRARRASSRTRRRSRAAASSRCPK